MHALLEPETDSEKIAFIGISNWKLDASKMNRGISLYRSEFGFEDLLETAFSIYNK